MEHKKTPSTATNAEQLSQKADYHKKWREEHPDYHKKWREEHPKYDKEWRRQHPEYYQTNEYKAKKRKWKKNYKPTSERIEKSKTYAKKHRQVLRTLLDIIKTQYQCRNPHCDSNKNLEAYCLDFHHVDKNSKEFSLGAPGGRSLKRLVCEIRKCTVLCAICHRRTHHGTLDISNYPVCKVNDAGEILE